MAFYKVFVATLTAVLAALAVAVSTGGVASAETVEVEMLNADPDDPRERNVFRPAVVQVEPGDTVRFVPTDRGHNAVSEKGPEGATGFRGRIGQPIEVTFETEGTHLYLCQPHRTLGMVGLVLVGDASANPGEIGPDAVRGRASRERLATYLDRARDLSDTTSR